MNLLPRRRLWCVALSLIAACSVAVAQDPVIPEWMPDVELAIGQLEEIVDGAQNQKLLNQTMASLYALYDSKLYMIYHSWIDMLTGDERVQQLGEQRRWLKRRSDVADSVSAANAGNSAAPMASYGAAIDLTKDRIAELEARLEAGLEGWRASRRKR